MVLLAEHYDFVIGGDPDRDTIDLAILGTGTGRVHEQTADRADGPAYLRLLAWAEEQRPLRSQRRRPRLGRCRTQRPTTQTPRVQETDRTDRTPTVALTARIRRLIRTPCWWLGWRPSLLV
jgi:hypothetical protein